MTTERLYEFLVLAKVLNYSKAARMLYISQPVLTRHIQDMEQELQTTLFERSTHGIALTEAGRLLARQCPQLIDQCDKALQLLQTPELPVKGTVRIACTLEIAQAAYLEAFLRRFAQHYPEIELVIDVLTAGGGQEILASYDFWLTPCHLHNLPGNIGRRRIASHGTYLLLPPGHPLMERSLISLHQLAGETLVVPYADEIFGPYFQNWVLAERSNHGQLRCVKVPDLPTALLQVRLGKGLCIVPRYAKALLPQDTFMAGILNRNCLFNEYFYYHEGDSNEAARLFYGEFCASCIRSEPARERG